jgi:two-component sensor histidine kinase
VSLSPVAGPGADETQQGQELRELFHRLNNQLGIVLAHAELLEAKAGDAANRERASQVVASALAALGTVRELRQRTEP